MPYSIRCLAPDQVQVVHSTNGSRTLFMHPDSAFRSTEYRTLPDWAGDFLTEIETVPWLDFSGLPIEAPNTSRAPEFENVSPFDFADLEADIDRLSRANHSDFSPMLGKLRDLLRRLQQSYVGPSRETAPTGRARARIQPGNIQSEGVIEPRTVESLDQGSCISDSVCYVQRNAGSWSINNTWAFAPEIPDSAGAYQVHITGGPAQNNEPPIF